MGIRTDGVCITAQDVAERVHLISRRHHAVTIVHNPTLIADAVRLLAQERARGPTRHVTQSLAYLAKRSYNMSMSSNHDHGGPRGRKTNGMERLYSIYAIKRRTA